MTTLPAGTVTFLLTDIEGSTRLAASHSGAFGQILDKHFELLDRAVKDNGGTSVSSEGDALFAVFPSARQAIAAAIGAQRALLAHSWPAGAAIKVRMGLHSGEAVFGGRDYTGLDVHRAARIANAAWGGEILISEATRALAGELPDGATLRDLGEHGLRDLPAPERLYQLIAPGLQVEFRPPRTLIPTTPTNLPSPVTRFVGRARELLEVRQLLDGARLVTLTGPGGTGKTRLAIETARRLTDIFPDGVWFVALDSVRDPSLVIPVVAQTLGVVEQPGRPLAATLRDHLAEKRSLIILDNLEHVIDVAPAIGELLAATTHLRLMGSSREPLGIAAERIYPVPTLGLPNEPGRPRAADLAGSESVELFVERAQAVRPAFALNDDNAADIAAICRRLDGLPLAIELAAARINLLSAAQIRQRLDDRLGLVAGARRDLPERQRTLRGAIDWSHDMLADPERTAFRRLSVFVGGAPLDAVPAVVDVDGDLGGDPIDTLALLVDRSLVRSNQESDEARFEMLETIREYAAEKLEEAGETSAIRDRHADFFADVAKSSADVLTKPDRDVRLDALDREMPNFRAALERSIETDNSLRGATIARGLKDFWRTRGHMAESRALVDALLEKSQDEGSTRARADLHGVAAELAAWHGDYPAARSGSATQIAMLQALGDRQGLGLALSTVGWGNLSTQPATSREAFEQSIAIARELNDLSVLLGALQGLAIALFRLGELDAARRSAEEAIAVGVASRDEYTNAFNILTLGLIEHQLGNNAAAAERFDDALRRSRAAGSALGMVVAFDNISLLALDEGDVSAAATLAAYAERTRVEIGGLPSMALVGLTPMVDLLRERDVGVYDRAAQIAATMTLDETVSVAQSVVARLTRAAVRSP